jgi:hypothetical protein
MNANKFKDLKVALDLLYSYTVQDKEIEGSEKQNELLFIEELSDFCEESRQAELRKKRSIIKTNHGAKRHRVT